MKRKSGIYKITINDKCYVGKSADLNKRDKEHQWMLEERKHHNPYLQNAYHKYQEYKFEVLEYADENLGEKERLWIEKLDTYKGDGYNWTTGGEDNTGTNNPMYGKKRPDLAERNRKGQGKSPESIMKMRKNRTGQFVGSKNNSYRHDVNTADLLADRADGMLYREIAEKHKMSMYGVCNRINGPVYNKKRIQRKLDLAKETGYI